jgi:hypothetical protein
LLSNRLLPIPSAHRPKSPDALARARALREISSRFILVISFIPSIPSIHPPKPLLSTLDNPPVAVLSRSLNPARRYMVSGASRQQSVDRLSLIHERLVASVSPWTAPV